MSLPLTSLDLQLASEDGEVGMCLFHSELSLAQTLWQTEQREGTQTSRHHSGSVEKGRQATHTGNLNVVISSS